MRKPSPEALRGLPSISQVDRHLQAQGLPSGKLVRARVQALLGEFRAQVQEGRLSPQGSGAREAGGLREQVLRTIAAALSRPAERQLQRVINATGVVAHTNLGRAPLAPATLQAVAPLLAAYTNLEFDLETGRRGERGGQVLELLAQLSGAEAALVVNNNAAAVLLLLSALAPGKEVIVSRGELVEIGGSFRVPDIMRQSGARLVEVGTTNRTRAEDYARAITADTAALLKVHRSNFVLSGFVEDASIAQLRELADARGLALWHDLGSGSFYRFRQPALQGQATVGDELRAGADVVTLSGDKLLGSVQCGIIVGRAAPLRSMGAHPLYRSLRVDKLRLALLEQDLLQYLQMHTLAQAVPSIGMLERTPDDMEPLARELVASLGNPRRGALRWEVVREHSLAGGGAAPGARLETLCLALTPAAGTATDLADRLRRHQPPIVGRIHEERVLLDLRTILPQDVEDVARAVKSLVA